jgi:8-oxo-dGTP diphosphatase
MPGTAVNFLLVKHGRYLLEWREDDHFAPGHWVVPGGKVEDGEEIFAALFREAEEELGLVDMRAYFLGSLDSGTWKLHPYLIRRWKGEVPKFTDAGSRLEWFSFGAMPPAPIYPPSQTILVRAVGRMAELDFRVKLANAGN